MEAQLTYICGWISIRTAGLDYLVEKSDENFEIVEARKIAGYDVEDKIDLQNVKELLEHVITHLKTQPDFLRNPLSFSDRLASALWGRSSRHAYQPLEEEVEQRQKVWSSLSFREDPFEGLSVLAVLLIWQQAAMLELQNIFCRLHEEIWCLEDTDADALFHVHGETRQAVNQAKELAKKCESFAGALLLPDPSWRKSWPDPMKVVSELEKGKAKLEEFQTFANKVSAQRRVFVARLKAVVEARAATEAVSATTLLAEALQPGKRLDFPLVTELCDRATSDQSELTQVAETLEVFLESRDIPTRLKVLTIINELLYDDAARQAFASRETFLRLGQASTDEANMALELAVCNANLLASEISRRLSSEVAVVQAVQAGCFHGSLQGTPNSSWLTSVIRTPERQDAQLEPLSWSRTRSAISVLEIGIRSGTASAADVIAVLDQTYRSFEHSTRSIVRLQESMEHAFDDDFKELINGYLLSASHVQSSALEWKCQVVDAADTAAPDRPNSSCMVGSQLKLSRKQLGKFLGRANSVGDSLNTCLAVLLARRDSTP